MQSSSCEIRTDHEHRNKKNDPAEKRIIKVIYRYIQYITVYIYIYNYMYIYKYIVHQHWGLKKTHEMEMGTKWGKTPTAETIFQETLGENWLGDDQADL